MEEELKEMVTLYKLLDNALRECDYLYGMQSEYYRRLEDVFEDINREIMVYLLKQLKKEEKK